MRADSNASRARTASEDLVTRKLAMIVDDLRTVTPFSAKPLHEHVDGAGNA